MIIKHLEWAVSAKFKAIHTKKILGFVWPWQMLACRNLGLQEDTMTAEQLDRMTLGWSQAELGQISGAGAAAVYLLERTGTAGLEDDHRIRQALAAGKRGSPVLSAQRDDSFR